MKHPLERDHSGAVPQGAGWPRWIAGDGGRRRWWAAAGVVLASVAFLAPTAAEAYDASWTAEFTTTSAHFLGVSCNDASGNTTCVAVGQSNVSGNGAVFRGTSTGTGSASITWTAVTLPTTGPIDVLQGVDCVSATSLCVAVGLSGTILRSANGGATWSRITGFTDDLNGVSCSSAAVCVAVGNDFGTLHPGGSRILRSADGGRTWQYPTSGLGAGGANAHNPISIDCPPGTTTCIAPAGPLGDGTSRVIRSSDGGVTFFDDAALPSYDLYGVSCASGTTCFVVGTSEIHRYVSGVWTMVAQAPDNLLAISCTGSSCYAVGYRGLAMTSADGGTTWVIQRQWDRAADPVYPNMWGVSCTTTRCRAAGQAQPGFSDSNGSIEKL